MIMQIIKGAGALTGAAVPLVAGAVSPGSKYERKDFRAQLKKFKNNKLGLTAGEQQQIVNSAVNPLQVQSEQADIARGLAGAGNNPAALAAATQLQAGKQQAMAGASAQASLGAAQLSQQLAQQQRAAILQRIEAKKQRAIQTGQQIGNAIASAAGNDSGGSNMGNPEDLLKDLGIGGR